MDKLQPILAHKYWIVFVAAMILPTTGWWIATGNVKGETETARAAADGAFGGVPKPDSPNATYAESVQRVNQALAKNNKVFNKYLWETQRLKQKWPASIDDTMQTLPYKGDIPVDIRRIYRKEYFPQLNDAPQIVDALSAKNPTGKIAFKLETFVPQVTRADWGTSPPDAETMWEVQEDLWLLRALLGAVADTNRGYDNILQAPVKQIDVIELRGGSPRSLSGDGAGDAEADPDAGPDMAGGEPGMAGGAGGFGSIRSSFGKSRSSQGGISIDLAEVFGPDVVQLSAGGDDDASAEPAMDDAAGPGAFGAFGVGQGQAKRRRYIDDEEGAPFKTRGFYLQVVIDHSKLPDLMVHLASLDWPVEIVRVQQQIRNPDSFAIVAGRNNIASGAGPGAGSARPAFQRRGLGGGGGRNNFGGPGVGNAGAAFDFDPGGQAGPMGPMGRRRRDRLEREKAAEAARMYRAAMQKTNLADVAIAGKLTLFQPPPKDTEPAADTDTKPEAQTTDAPAETPPADSPPKDPTNPVTNDGRPVSASGTAPPVPPSGDSKTEADQAEQKQPQEKKPPQ